MYFLANQEIIWGAIKTKCWFITNGLNAGVSQMVGDALSEKLVKILNILLY
jgi:hypothetical protein